MIPKRHWSLLMTRFSKNKILDKSRSTKRTDTENTVDKSRSIPRTNLSNKSTRIQNPSEIDIHGGNLSVSVLSGQGEILSSVSPDIIFIIRNNKRKKYPDTSIIRKQPIKEPVNPRKKKKENNLTDVEKFSSKETPPLFQNKVNYKGDTNEKTHSSDN